MARRLFSIRVALLAPLALAAAFFAFAPQSQAANPRNLQTSDYTAFIGQPQSVAIDSGFIYWTDFIGKSRKAPPIARVLQRSILTGVTRELFTAKAGFIHGVSAGGGRVAFLNNQSTGDKFPQRVTGSLYTMDAGDAKPSLLKAGTMNFKRIRIETKRNGKTRRGHALTSCGDGIELVDMSETGQVLASETTVRCGDEPTFSRAQLVFTPNVQTPTRVPTDDNQYALAFSHNLVLIDQQSGGLIARNFTTGAEQKLKVGSYITSTSTTATGHVAIVSSGKFKKTRNGDRRPTSANLTIFPPNSSLPLAGVPLNPRAETDVNFCGDTILQVTSGKKGLSKLTLRDLAGAVITEIDGPPARNYRGAICNGRHVVTTSLYSSGPALSAYDL